jgi:hypothetical protein
MKNDCIELIENAFRSILKYNRDGKFTKDSQYHFQVLTLGKLVITTAVSKVSRNLGYCGLGSRGVSEKYPSSAADSSSRFGSLILFFVLFSYVL